MPSGGIAHASFCPPDKPTDPNDRAGFSEKLRPYAEEDEFEKVLAMDEGMEFIDLIADDEEKEDEGEVGAPHDGIISSGSPNPCVVGRGVCMAYASSNSLVKVFVVIGVLASGLA